MSAKLRFVAVVGLLALAFAPGAPRASACENVVLRTQSAVLRDVQRAEELLEAGYPARSIAIIARNSLVVVLYARVSRSPSDTRHATTFALWTSSPQQ